VVGRVDGVVGRSGKAGLNVTTSKEEGGSDESSAETRDDSNVDSIVTVLAQEGTRVASPDILGSGLGVAAVVTSASQNVVGNLARNLARVFLGVDSEGVGSILAPDLVDVVIVVVAESTRVNIVVVAWGQHSDRCARRGSNALRGPGTTIRVLLSRKIVADLGDSITTKSLGDLRRATTVDVQGHTEDNSNKINVGDVGIEGLIDVGELDKAPVDVSAGVSEVGSRRLDKTIAVSGVNHEELEGTLREVDSARAHLDGKSYGGGLTLGVQGDGKVGGDGDGRLGTTRAGVDKLSAGSDKDDVAITVETLDVGVDSCTSEVVDQLERNVGCDSSGTDGGGLLGIKSSAVESVFVSDNNVGIWCN